MLIVLLEHGIDISCLTMLNEEMIKEIVPKIGDRAKLITNLSEWRKVIELTNSKTDYMVSIQNSCLSPIKLMLLILILL